MYWFLVMRKRPLGVARGDIAGVKGRSIGAAPWVEMGLRRLLIEAGIDLARDNVTIAPVPGAAGAGVNFGVTAAKALEERKIDGFWANGMGSGGGGAPRHRHGGAGCPAGRWPRALFQLHDGGGRGLRPSDRGEAGGRRGGRAGDHHGPIRRLAQDAGPRHAAWGSKLFPPAEGRELIAELIRRDLPYYEAQHQPRISSPA